MIPNVKPEQNGKVSIPNWSCGMQASNIRQDVVYTQRSKECACSSREVLTFKVNVMILLWSIINATCSS